MVDKMLEIEVALAMPERQEVKLLELAPGSSVADAIEQSGILKRFSGFEFDPQKVGIFGHKTTLDTLLRDGDRVEIYRPLRIDPKELRHQRALKQSKKPVDQAKE